MSMPGISTGFISFGTYPHLILLALHEVGDMKQSDLVEYLGLGHKKHNAIGTAVSRMVKHGLIYRARKVPSEPPLYRAVWLYTLRPVIRAASYKPKTAAERTRKYRIKEKMVQPSVFTFRGRIEL